LIAALESRSVPTAARWFLYFAKPGRAAMPRYTFKLSDDGSGVEDDVGVSLPNAEAAYRYACNVVLELMNCRELRTRHWQLDVYEAEGKKVLKFLS
jgi:hypothetical protein